MRSRQQGPHFLSYSSSVFSLKFRFFGSDGSAILSPDFYTSSNLS